MHDLLLTWCIAPAAAALAWLPGPSRRRGGLGALLVAGGAASLAVAAGGGTTLDPLRLAALPATTTVIDGGAVALGWLLLGWAALPGIVQGTWATRLASGVLLAASVLLAVATAPVPRAAGAPGAAVVAVVLLAVGAVLAAAVGRVGGAHLGGRAEDRRVVALVAAAAAGAVWLPNAIGVIGAALVAIVLAARGRGWAAWLGAATAGAGLIVFAWLASTIAGPFGLAVRTLPDAPFSTAAQAMLIVALAVGAAPYFGLWPFHHRHHPLLTVIGVALLVRLGSPALPDGLEAWQTVLVPVGVAALWQAAWTRRWTGVLGAGAWLACSVLPGGAAAAGAWALALAEGVTLARGFAVGQERSPAAPAGLALVLALAAWGGARAWPALIGAQVVYGVLAFAGVAVSIMLATARAPGPDPQPAPESGD